MPWYITIVIDLRRIRRANANASAAIDTVSGIHVQLGYFFKLGFIFSRGENVDAAEAALKAAHAELSFSIAGELPVLSAG